MAGIEAVAEAQGTLNPLHPFKVRPGDHLAVVLAFLRRHLQPVEKLPPLHLGFPFVEVDQLANQAVNPAAEATGTHRLRISVNDLHFLLAFDLGHRCWITQLRQQLTGGHLQLLLVGAGLLVFGFFCGSTAPFVVPKPDRRPLRQI